MFIAVINAVVFAIMSFFFLLLLPPPRSTLFPYTTLFRSVFASHILRAVGLRRTVARFVPAQAFAQLKIPLTVTATDLDRKSTRLNSSHANISYAVFCLKKKKKKKTHKKLPSPQKTIQYIE